MRSYRTCVTTYHKNFWRSKLAEFSVSRRLERWHDGGRPSHWSMHLYHSWRKNLQHVTQQIGYSSSSDVNPSMPAFWLLNCAQAQEIVTSQLYLFLFMYRIVLLFKVDL